MAVSSEDALPQAARTVQVQDSGKPATGEENLHSPSQNEIAGQGKNTDGRPLLPERPGNFNPMTPPSMPDLDASAYPQPMNSSASVSALYMAQLASYLGQLAFFMRCLLAGMITLILFLLGGTLYLRSAVGRAMRSADASLAQTENARREIASLKRLVSASMSAQNAGNGFSDDDLSEV